MLTSTMALRNNRYQGIRPHERQLLRPQRTSSSYGSFDPLRLPSLDPPPPYAAHPNLVDSGPPSSNLPPAAAPPVTTDKGSATGRSIGVTIVLLVVVTQIVAFIFFCNLPSMIDQYNRIKEELRKEREKWEKAREDRVPQGAFWGVVQPALVCRAYGRREYGGMLQNIPKDWTDVDACMNMPVEIKGVTLRRPYRCAYVEGSPHIHGYWMVDWDQPDCKPWHRDFHDTVRGRRTMDGTP